MAKLTPGQARTRARVETLIKVMAPGLNLILAAGDRLSRIAEPEDSEYYPIRSGLVEGDRDPAPKGAHETRLSE